MIDQPDSQGEESTDSQADWLSISAAALRLGLSENAVRARAKRGTLKSRRTTDGRILVALEAIDSLTSESPQGIGKGSADSRDSESALVKQLRSENVFLRDQLRVRDVEIERRALEAERMQVLLQTEQQQVKALTDQRQQASWWRRRFQR